MSTAKLNYPISLSFCGKIIKEENSHCRITVPTTDACVILFYDESPLSTELRYLAEDVAGIELRRRAREKIGLACVLSSPLLGRTGDVLPFRRRTITARGGGGGVVLENEFLKTQRGRARRSRDTRKEPTEPTGSLSLLYILYSLKTLYSKEPVCFY